MLACLLFPFPADGGWKLETLPDEWHFAGFENSLDISGVAAANGRQCLVGSDESFYVQPGVIQRAKKRIESRRPIALPLKNENGGKLEIDIEGIAYSKANHAYYVVGSHGLGKKKGDFQPERFAVHRLGVDTATGLVKPGDIQRGSLLPWLEKTPRLAPYVKEKLQANGLNIEGLASRGGKLYFGLRSPNIDDHAFVIEIDSDKLFNGTPARELTLHRVKLGRGRGIREIATVHDGFVILAGSAGAEATKKIPHTLYDPKGSEFSLLLWDGKSAVPELLGTLESRRGKAEGLLVLENKPGRVELLVIYDSLPGGLPTALRLTRAEQ